jgi:hypothetical protein
MSFWEEQLALLEAEKRAFGYRDEVWEGSWGASASGAEREEAWKEMEGRVNEGEYDEARVMVRIWEWFAHVSMNSISSQAERDRNTPYLRRLQYRLNLIRSSYELSLKQQPLPSQGEGKGKGEAGAENAEEGDAAHTQTKFGILDALKILFEESNLSILKKRLGGYLQVWEDNKEVWGRYPRCPMLDADYERALRAVAGKDREKGGEGKGQGEGKSEVEEGLEGAQAPETKL